MFTFERRKFQASSVPAGSPSAGYPIHLIVSIAECILRWAEGTQDKSTTIGSPALKKEIVAVVLYIQQVSHNLNKVAGKSYTGVLFSAPYKLRNLCKKANPDKNVSVVCPKKHSKPFFHAKHASFTEFLFPAAGFTMGRPSAASVIG